MMILISTYLKDQIYPPLSNALSAVPAAQSELTSIGVTFSIFDYIFLFVFMMMMIVPIIFAFLVPTNPVFILINIILLIFYVLIVPSISNVMRSFWSQTAFAPYATGGTGSTTFMIMTTIFQNLPIITTVFAIILCIVMFNKSGGGNL
jgi:hypothetical protein